MPNTTILPQNEKVEPNDVPKKFTNIDNEDFVFSWDNRAYVVKAGKTVVLPKYQVNYAAMTLGKKMYKRDSLARYNALPPAQQTGFPSLRNEKAEFELQKQMVIVNFPNGNTPKEWEILKDTLKETPLVLESVELEEVEVKEQEVSSSEPIKENPQEDLKGEIEKNPLSCDKCVFTAKTEFGLRVHQRKHNK